jgi:uncharacterized surface protein with fasciclin (FAS1) repeats
LNGLASVATADVMNTNGVIHVIDKVQPDERCSHFTGRL